MRLPGWLPCAAAGNGQIMPEPQRAIQLSLHLNARVRTQPAPPATHPPTLLTHPPAILQVLGRSEFKQLLRWRLMIKKDLQRAAAAAAKAAKAAGEGGEEEGGSDEEEEDPEEKLLREMGEVKAR